MDSPTPLPPGYARGRPRALAFLLLACLVLLIFGLIAYRLIAFTTVLIPNASMEPTLMGHDSGVDPARGVANNDSIHDLILVSKLAYRTATPQCGDIVLFRAPKEADAQGMANHHPKEINMVKRVIGVPGDTIQVKAGQVTVNGVPKEASVVYRNGQRLNEPYLLEPMDSPQPTSARFAEGQPLKLGKDQLFVMGDNRNDSNDSRYWGALECSRVIGKAVQIIAPSARLRSFP